MSQSSEFCHHNALDCFSTSVYYLIDAVLKLLDTPSYKFFIWQMCVIGEFNRFINKFQSSIVFFDCQSITNPHLFVSLTFYDLDYLISLSAK